MTSREIIIAISLACMSSQMYSLPLLGATDPVELNTCYTMYSCRTDVVEISLPKLAGGVLECAK